MDASRDPFSTGDVLKLVIERLKSQTLLFTFGVIIVIVVGAALLGPDKALPIVLIVGMLCIVGLVAFLFVEQKQKLNRGDPAAASRVLREHIHQISAAHDLGLKVWTEPAGPPAVKGASPGAVARDIAVVEHPDAPKPDIAVKKLDEATYRIGDRIVVKCQAQRDCHITILNLGTSGKLTTLLPNQQRATNFVKAGETITVPGPGDSFHLELSGPPGVERIKAIATVDDTPIMNGKAAPMSTGAAVFRSVPPTAAARDIAVVKDTVEKLPTGAWDEAETTVVVEPATKEGGTP